MFAWLKRIFGTAQDRILRKYAKIVMEINRLEIELQSVPDEMVRAKTQEFRDRLKNGEPLEQLLPEAYAVVKNVCRRLCGTDVHVSGYDQKWDMIPYDVQLLAGIAMHYGCIAEMQTGEGKTLTAVFPLYLNALTGRPVHLITVNDYLAQRDCQWVGGVLRWLGLTTASLTNDTPMEERKQIYGQDVVYGTSSEFGFDYLRDNSISTVKEEQVQRGYFFGIVDEIDSILIDEARTPLIISGPTPVSRQMYDTLKGKVDALVRLQRDYCNRLASEARKTLEKIAEAEAPANKETQIARQEALRKLWLVGKGTPHNKVLKRLKEDPDLRADLDKLDLYYYGDQNKQERADQLAQLYIIVDERANEFELTDKGINAWQEHAENETSDDFVMLDYAHEYHLIDNDPTLDDEAKMQKKLFVQEEDAKRKERAHNLRQLLRAHLLLERDIDYIIQDNKIVIIDEHTGRPQPGRRFSDGLHQAIEAKELVPIQRETQTYATVTLQNFFRMYEKLSGMTGTAATEANEFKQIYKLEVLVIPSNKPCRRKDANDEIYMSEREKYNAILKAIKEIHEKGRPILIGTESVEVSEKLSRVMKQNKLEHNVLNAKQHDREAEIIAHAGKKGAITIATNMAGRGTDIKLEPGVADLGGLHVIGSTRHQSRRIDRQLRGRCARQGDPGTSFFYISFEDPLLRMFTSPKITGLLQRLRPPEGEPISASVLNRSVETAQKRIEQRNYNMRKHTLEYDDVMNKQRQTIYAFRNEILHTEDIRTLVVELLETVCGNATEQFFQSRSSEEGWDPEGYRQWLMQHFPVSFEEGYFSQDLLDPSEIEKMATDKVVAAFQEKIMREESKIAPEHRPEKGLVSNGAIRHMMIRRIDRQWQEHLLKMDHLRTDVNLRSVGQRDPLTEFKHEAFSLFDQFSRTVRTEIAQDLFRFEIKVRPVELSVMQEMLPSLQLETTRSFLPELEGQQPQSPQQQSQQPPAMTASLPFVRKVPAIPIPQHDREEEIFSKETQVKAGRNELCPCGSGKKFKKCCSAQAE